MHNSYVGVASLNGLERLCPEQPEATRFLCVQVARLELGDGFAFVGEQVHLEVGGGLLPRPRVLPPHARCFVVIDLKARRFTPEAAGKMNFYLSAADDLLRHPGDSPVRVGSRNPVVNDCHVELIRPEECDDRC